jgi:putative serine protease PepD
LSRLAGVVALVLLAGGTGGAVGAKVATDRAVDDASATAGTSASTAGATPLVSPGGSAPALDVAAVLNAVEGAVADIQSTGPGFSGQGSGVVYRADGLVLTNAHVVDGATRVTVTTTGDRQARAATVVGVDTDKDVAVLRLSNTDGLDVAALGQSSSLRVGEDVVAIGNALGLRGDPSVTRGIVSALDRSLGELTGLIQTDAAINSGNSGGPLVNAAGQVIGINTAIAVSNNAQNIGFAIPIDEAKAVADRLVSGSSSTPVAFLGVSTMDNTSGTTGAVVAEVSAGSPAATAGIQPGDVIVAVDGRSVAGAGSLSTLVGNHQVGDVVKVTIVRGGQEQALSATLGRR